MGEGKTEMERKRAAFWILEFIQQYDLIWLSDKKLLVIQYRCTLICSEQSHGLAHGSGKKSEGDKTHTHTHILKTNAIFSIVIILFQCSYFIYLIRFDVCRYDRATQSDERFIRDMLEPMNTQWINRAQKKEPTTKTTISKYWNWVINSVWIRLRWRPADQLLYFKSTDLERILLRWR